MSQSADLSIKREKQYFITYTYNKICLVCVVHSKTDELHYLSFNIQTFKHRNRTETWRFYLRRHSVTGVEDRSVIIF